MLWQWTESGESNPQTCRDRMSTPLGDALAWVWYVTMSVLMRRALITVSMPCSAIMR